MEALGKAYRAEKAAAQPQATLVQKAQNQASSCRKAVDELPEAEPARPTGVHGDGDGIQRLAEGFEVIEIGDD